MPTLFNRTHKKFVDLDVMSKPTVSTLLIPASIAEKLNSILPVSVNKNGSEIVQFASALHSLLEKYRGFFAVGNLPFHSKPKLTFQDDNLNLQTFKFRPNHADWFELGIIAYGLGDSRCWLFTYMLELELSGIGEFLALKPVRDVLATPRVSRPRKVLQITGKRRFLNRILHFRV